jgi:biofilm PGA synthesis N-glycosyltransferase PgaC
VKAVVDAIVHGPVYAVAMAYLATYPIISSLFWIVGSVLFARHREGEDVGFYAIDEHPFVSVLVAARNEEAVIEQTVERLLALDWPAFEVMVVDDGSTDRTREILNGFVQRGAIRVLHKPVNEGKAMALNDALPLLRGEIVLLVDADGRPNADVLRWMVPHFVRVPRVAAITGNPRVVNTTTLLAKLQAIEFSATVSVLRRAQMTWGRLMTFSGICTAVRKSAVESVGRFRPEMATEDISMAWQLQTQYHDVRYEPRAVFAMQVPETLGVWWKQRTRWARGLGQVLRANAWIFRDWRKRRLWPVYIEASLSSIWSILLIAGVTVWVAAFSTGVFSFGANPIPNFWGMVIAAIGIVQILVGLSLDGRYDPQVRRYALWVPLYPLVYWVLNASAAARAMLPGFIRRPRGVVSWQIPRYEEIEPSAEDLVAA